MYHLKIVQWKFEEEGRIKCFPILKKQSNNKRIYFDFMREEKGLQKRYNFSQIQNAKYFY